MDELEKKYIELKKSATKETGVTLLFVDDEQNILSSLKRLFRPIGYRILLANNGQDGLDVLKKEKIDLVISDMRMPQMDGAEFLSKVKKHWPDTIRILLTGYADISATVEAINSGQIFKYVSKPWNDNDLLLSVKLGLEKKYITEERDKLLRITKKQNEKLRQFNEKLETKVKERTAALLSAKREIEEAHLNLKQTFVSSIKVFTNLLGLRGGEDMAGHSRKVAEHARKLATELGLKEETIQSVLFAGLLHDIGKIVLPDRLLNKAFNAMNAEDKAEYARHPIVGEGALINVESFQDVGQIIRAHHEQYDGSGYPDGLKGDEIPIGARVLSVVNEYYAIQEGTLMSQRMGAKEAREYIVRNRHKRYDPKVVAAFMKPYTESSQQKAIQENIVEVGTHDLKSGMILAKDLITKEGMLLVPKDQNLNETLIEKIKNFELSLHDKLWLHICLPRFDNSKDVNDFMIKRKAI